MKTLIKNIMSFLETFGQARAAASLARAGKYEEAKSIYGTKP